MTPTSGHGFQSVGFSGSAEGMTVEQENWLRRMLRNLYSKGFAEFHHGDCIGSDKQAHSIAKEMGYAIIIHPPLDAKARAYCEGDYMWPEKDYLQRNHDIALQSNLLLATPKTSSEVLRSGTWSTIRYARKIGVKVMVKAGDVK